MRKANTSRWPLRARRGALLLLAPVLALAAPPAAPAPSVPVALPPAASTEAAKAWPLPPDRRQALPARPLDAARLRALRNDPALQYAEEGVADLNFWDRFWRWVGRWLGRLLSTPQGELTWKYGWYAALVAALVFAVLKLLQVDLTGAFGRSPRRSGLGYDVLAEDIHGVDFPARIAEAEEAGNYRLAVRLGYLEALKHLSDQGHLRWEADKTNQAYLHKLPAGPLREAFRVATRQFEYVWYGELPLVSASYATVRAAQRTVLAAASSTTLAAA